MQESIFTVAKLNDFAPTVRSVTRETTLEYNRQVAVLAAEIVVPYVAACSSLEVLLEKSVAAIRR